MLNSTEHENSTAHKTKILTNLNLSDVVFILLINVKMPTIVDILTFMSRINIVLSSVEYEKKFYNPRAWTRGLNFNLILHLVLYVVMGESFQDYC